MLGGDLSTRKWKKLGTLATIGAVLTGGEIYLYRAYSRASTLSWSAWVATERDANGKPIVVEVPLNKVSKMRKIDVV